MTRRSFIAASSLLPALDSAASGAAGAQRMLLSRAWPAEAIAAVLAPLDRFHPLPLARQRESWDRLPADLRAALVQSGARQMETPWQPITAALFLEFHVNGNRSRFEAAYDGRRRKLKDLVIAECVEGKGRFTPEIVNGIWTICEETFWGLPAHMDMQKAGLGLPDVREPIVDLFAAETASLLAWSYYLLRDHFAAVAKLVPERIQLEIERRILVPCFTRTDFDWMGYRGNAPGNWDPWICSNWLACTLLMEQDERRRCAAVSKILTCLDHFLSGYADDGGWGEGPGYWNRAGRSLFDCLYLLLLATNGKCNAGGDPLIHEIALYICRTHIHDEWYTNFGDAPARL